ncbi:MAG: flagellar hook-associated protein FlgK [Proteobacteria bacterium]|nr:flagellar hook-associated protein FlgK [Pseudomonadota bacterium]
MSDLLSIGTSGLLAAQKGLDTIANNIANASTPGYNRQVSLFDTLPSVKIGSGYAGSGVGIIGTERIVDSFIVQSLREQQTNLSEAISYNDILSQLDNLLADPGLGISDGLNLVFNSLQSINNSPSTLPERQMFIAQAQILQNRFNQLSKNITSQYQTINAEIVENVNTINNLVTQIADINMKIQNLGQLSFTSAPNELLDQRENLLLTLSEYVGVSTTDQGDGSVNVFIGNGQTLVIGTKPTYLMTQPNALDSMKTDIVVSDGTAFQNISNSFVSGKTGGLLNIRENVLPQALNSLGRIAIAIGLTFNAQHNEGIDLNGNLGTDLFNDPNTFTAKLNRVTANVNNKGTGVFSVSIDPIATKAEDPDVFSSATTLVNAGTLNPLTFGTLIINNVSIRPTVVGDDTVSTTDALGSAIAIAKAINSQSAAHGVQASAQPNVVYLGKFTTGALAAGNLTLNGINVISTGVDEQTLLQDINALSAQTGVIATGDGNLNITLVAQDGRNIELAKTVNSAAANFSYFTMNAGAASNMVAKASVELTTTTSEFIKISGNPASVGFTAGTTPVPNGSLSIKDYILSYDGSLYTLRYYPDLTIIGQSATPNFAVDGFNLTIESGTVAANDSFIIRPTRFAARDFDFLITDPMMLAVAMPVKADADLANKGTGSITVTDITDTSGTPIGNQYKLGNAFSKSDSLTPPISVVFVTPTLFRVFDISAGLPGKQLGPDQTYDPTSLKNAIFPISGVVDTTPPGPNVPYVFDPGYRITIEGIPQAGDVFTISYNSQSEGDNRNGLLLSALQFAKTLLNNTSTFQDVYTQFVGGMGSQASQAEINLDSRQSLMDSIQSRRNEISGVNLDEEAANLLKYEQAYQATAQVIVIAKGVFDSLIQAIGG